MGAAAAAAAKRRDPFASKIKRERQAEVDRIRALRVVETKTGEVAPILEMLINPFVASSASDTPRVNPELDMLASNRRVQGISRAFREELEAIFGAQAQAAQITTSRPGTRSTPRRTSSIAHTRRTFAALQDSLPTPSTLSTSTRMRSIVGRPPAGNIALPVHESLNELDEIAQYGAVTAQLNNRGFVNSLCRLLRSRVSNAEVAQGASRTSRLQTQLQSAITARRRNHDADRESREHEDGALVGWAARHAQERDQPSAHEASGILPVDGCSLRELRDTAGATLNLLLSMQRTLNHQVAASLAAQPTGAPPCEGEDWVMVPRYTSAAAITSNLGACLVCTSKSADAVFYRCGHLCACISCAHTLTARGLRCPICRSPIDDVVQVFIACAAMS